MITYWQSITTNVRYVARSNTLILHLIYRLRIDVVRVSKRATGVNIMHMALLSYYLFVYRCKMLDIII